MAALTSQEIDELRKIGKEAGRIALMKTLGERRAAIAQVPEDIREEVKKLAAELFEKLKQEKTCKK